MKVYIIIILSCILLDKFQTLISAFKKGEGDDLVWHMITGSALTLALIFACVIPHYHA